MEELGLAEQADVLEECASSSALTPNFVTPMQSHSSCSEAASSPFYSARIEGLSEPARIEGLKVDNQLELDVEASKSHWTELSSATGNSDDSDEDRVVFEIMKEHLVWGPLFRIQIHELEIGAKIGEGGQAEIFEAVGRSVRNPYDVSCPNDGKTRLVLKVFKKGYSLVGLQRSWPPALALAEYQELVYGHAHVYVPSLCCAVGGHAHVYVPSLCCAVGVRLMDDGRFAFIFHRHWGDFRKLIDEKMLKRIGCPLFDCYVMHWLIKNIAKGMCNLQKVGILHNDLKAGNVLISDRLRMRTIVADFESSTGIVERGFWRAPEILLALKNRTVKKEIFTQQTDVYSFAMTCYEVIRGCMPFEDHDKCDYDIILRGERPTLVNDIPYSMFNDLVTRCWRQDPQARPSFAQILENLKDMDMNSLRKEWLSRRSFL